MKLVPRAAQREQGLSHDPEIRKRVLLGPDEIPGLTGFSRAVFKPGQRCSRHAHPSMIEVFLVESGNGEILVQETTHPLEEGACVVVEAGELHQLANIGSSDLVLTYFGLAVQV